MCLTVKGTGMKYIRVVVGWLVFNGTFSTKRLYIVP